MSLGGLLWRSARSAWWTSRRTGRGAFGFHRLIANQGTEVGMQEFFEKLVLGGCSLVELSAAGRGLVRRHDRLVAILAADD